VRVFERALHPSLGLKLDKNRGGRGDDAGISWKQCQTYEAAPNSVKAFPGKLDNGSVPGSPAGTSNGFVIVP
jgi:hypothetical protein